MRDALTASFLLHVMPLIILALLFGAGGKGGGNAMERSDLKAFQPRPDAGGEPQPVDVEIVKDDFPLKKKPNLKKRKKDCPGAWYGGIGISQIYDDFGTIIVDDVAKDYPADRAGIQRGDHIRPLGEIRGEPGTQVTVMLKTTEEDWHAITLTREKICYEKLDNAQDYKPREP